jgi:hypothetical protein
LNEQAFQVGADRHLVGVWTPPQGVRRRLAVLLLNAGVIHHIGPHRTSVKLARHLARRGFGCARFDTSGVGDSLPPAGAADFRAQAVADVRSVMDAVQREQGVADFVLLGICSGAAHAQATALVDVRVRGVFLIDGYVYPTRRGHWEFARRMMRAYGLAGFVSRVARHAQARAAVRDSAVQAPADDGPHRTREEFDGDMTALAARQVRVALMFTGSYLEHYGYARQLHDSFAGSPWLERVDLLFEPEVDHTVTLLAAQKRLLELATPWIESVAASASR